MNTREINKQLRQLSCFIGTFPRDQLPKIKKRPAALVVNMDTSAAPGSHWVALFFTADGEGEYYDSYGLPPLFKNLVAYLDGHSPKGWSYNNLTLQSLNSKTCGLYCILFIKMRCRGVPFCEIKQLFSNNTFINDKIVEMYASN